jgi:hypothetical protein
MSIQSIPQPLFPTNNPQFQSSNPSLRLSSPEHQISTMLHNPPARAQPVHSNKSSQQQTTQQTLPTSPQKNTHLRPIKVGHIVWAHLENNIDHPYWPCKVNNSSGFCANRNVEVYRINREHYLVQFYGVAEEDKW